MGYRQHQTQSFCIRCQRMTLHTGNLYEVPHLAHLCVSVLLCFLWLPIWIMHTIADALAASEPLRCVQCGEVQSMPQRRPAMLTAVDTDPGRDIVQEAMLVARTGMVSLGALPGRGNEVLKSAIGEENVIVLRFTQALVVVGMLAMGLWVIGSLVG